MSGNESITRIQADDAAWSMLLDQEAFDFSDDLTETPLDDLLQASDEVLRVSRRIAGQYVDVIAKYAASAFGRSATAAVGLDQVQSAATTLLRLANASNDVEQVALLDHLLGFLHATADKKSSRARDRALAQLRAWIPAFALTLEQQDADRLLSLVEWDSGSAPLLDELAEIRGIGPRRLQRLYSAGLFTVDVVASAHPDDIVAVTGIPNRLAHDVVSATQSYALEERQRCTRGIVQQVHRLRHVLRASPEGGSEFAEATAAALREVQAMLSEIEASWPAGEGK